MVVNYYFTVFYDVWECITLFSQGGLWFVLERAYAKEWGSPHKNSWLKCKMLWTAHKDVLPQCCTLPSQSWPSSSSPGTDVSCPLNMLQITLLPGKSVLFLCLISWHFSMKSQGGSGMSPSWHVAASSRNRCLSAHQGQLPCLLSSQPLAGHPFSLTPQAQVCVLGCKRRLCGCTPMIPRGHILCNRGSPWAHIQRCGWTSHCAVPQHTAMSDNNVQFTGLDMDMRMHGMGSSDRKKYTSRETDI